MLTTSLAATGLAILCWPDQRAACRMLVRPVSPVWGGHRLLAWLRKAGGLAVPLAAACSFVSFGVGGAVGGAVLATAVRGQWRQSRQLRARIAATEQLAAAARTLVAELRAGSHPAVAAEAAAAEAAPRERHALRTVAATARLGGDPAGILLDAHEGASRDATHPLRQLGRSWSLAQRYGLPLADVLDALARDLEATAQLAGATRARMAGPRASAAVLALLPVAGLALGEAMGAGPLRLLGTTTAGQVLLSLGAALTAVGLAWSGRITRQGALP